MRPIGIGLGVGFIAGAAAGVTPVAAWDASTSTLAQLTALASVSRPSLATMFDSTGKLTYAPNNLALNTATLGTQSVTVHIGVNYLISFASGGGSIALSGAGSGTVTSASPVKITASTSTLTLTVTGTVTNAVVAAVTYETTPRAGDQVITTAAAYYGPRIDYDPNTLAVKGLLIEEARTNLQLNSGALNGANWFASNVTKSSTPTGPDGVSSSAQTVTASAGNAAHFVVYASTVVIVSGSTYTYSVYAKAGTSNYALVNLYGNAAGHWASAVFDLSSVANTTASQTAQGATSGAITSTSQQSVGGGWFRLSVTGSLNRVQFDAIFGFAGAATGNTFDSYGCVTFNAAGTETLTFYGPQIELGSFATSYIPTAASSVTRAADALSAASLSTNPAIIQYRSESTGVRARKVINPWSGVSSEVDEWIEAIRIYPSGTSGTYLNTKLTVDGPW